MGFRTTIITEDFSGIKIPKWFVNKWGNDFNFGEHKNSYILYHRKNTLLISSKREKKMYYGKDEEIFLDIQKICIKKGLDKFIVIMLHECGGITRVQIERDKIRLSEPSAWNEVEEVTHNYCYGCSDLDKK